MSKDTISVNMNIYDIPIIVEQLKKLEQENKQLKEKINKVFLMIDEISKIGYEYKGTYYSPIPLKYCDVLLVIKEILGDKE